MRVGPSARPVELGDDRRPKHRQAGGGRTLVEPHLVDAILIAVERQQPAIAGKANARQRVENAVGRQLGIGWLVRARVHPAHCTGGVRALRSAS